MVTERHIMVVDDDADDRMLFEDALKEVCHKTRLTSLNDGMDLMDVLAGENAIKPDIIFLDINMPGKNGFECLESIRTSPLLKAIPVILYSTCTQEETINKAYNYGANFYVSKPSNFNLLKKIIAVILNADFKDPVTRSQFVIKG